MLVLDTNIVSALMHRSRADLDHLALYGPDDVVLTAPVAAEIHFGLERLPLGARRRALLAREYGRLREAVTWRDWTEAAALEFGRQKARLQTLGTVVEDMDIAIGALAISLGAELATRNLRHFDRLEGLSIADWPPP